MLAKRITVGMFQENCWVAVCEETREAVIVDPGDEAERIAALVSSLDATPIRILNTHAHLDHVGAVAELKARYGIPFCVHEGERENLEQMASHAMAFGMEPPPAPRVDEWIAEGDVYEFGRESLRVVETPGHTAGGVSLVGTGRVFVGDTLFAGSIGRTDLPGGDFETLRASIRGKLFRLPPETACHCGHMGDTTIGREKATNPFVGDGANPALFGF